MGSPQVLTHARNVREALAELTNNPDRLRVFVGCALLDAVTKAASEAGISLNPTEAAKVVCALDLLPALLKREGVNA